MKAFEKRSRQQQCEHAHELLAPTFKYFSLEKCLKKSLNCKIKSTNPAYLNITCDLRCISDFILALLSRSLLSTKLHPWILSQRTQELLDILTARAGHRQLPSQLNCHHKASVPFPANKKKAFLRRMHLSEAISSSAVIDEERMIRRKGKVSGKQLNQSALLSSSSHLLQFSLLLLLRAAQHSLGHGFPKHCFIYRKLYCELLITLIKHQAN